MSAALFSPLIIGDSNDEILFKAEGAGSWTTVNLDHGTYASLQELLAELDDEIASMGYGVSLDRDENAAGVKVAVSHTTAFELKFTENSPCLALGFDQTTYTPAQTKWESPNAPAATLVVDGLRMDSGPGSAIDAAFSVSLNGKGEGAQLMHVSTRRLRFTGLSEDQWNRLLEMWIDASLNAGMLIYDDDWQARIGADTYRRLETLACDTQRQTKFIPKRTWPAPNPARYDVDLFLERR